MLQGIQGAGVSARSVFGVNQQANPSIKNNGQSALANAQKEAAAQHSKGQSGSASATDQASLSDKFRCHTCENRQYQDGSDDPGVSFKSAAKLSPQAAASAVTSHEQEHVSRERQKASEEGREVVAQDVKIHTGICPECGKTYVSGGTTTTVTMAAKSSINDGAISDDGEPLEGRYLDAIA